LWKQSTLHHIFIMQRSHSDTCISHGPDGDRYHNCLHIHLRSQTMHDHVHVFGSRHCRNLHIDNPTGCITCELPICGTISNYFNNFDMLKDICLRLSELANMVLCSPWKTSDNNEVGIRWLKKHCKFCWIVVRLSPGNTIHPEYDLCRKTLWMNKWENFRKEKLSPFWNIAVFHWHVFLCFDACFLLAVHM